MPSQAQVKTLAIILNMLKSLGYYVKSDTTHTIKGTEEHKTLFIKDDVGILMTLGYKDNKPANNLMLTYEYQSTKA